MNELDLNDVSTFVSVAQAGTLTAAAKELHCPASTLSRALTRLEKHLGVLLVQRGPRGLVMTDAGKEYLQTCPDGRCRPFSTDVTFWKTAASAQAGS